MTPQLSDIEARVIGCLIEKQIATPDQYPLTLNALIAACNQKSNRDPLLALAELDVQAALGALTRRDLVLERFGLGNRVPKYQQLFCNTEFGSLRFSPVQTAIVCELLLRGPQTPGELRTRAVRLAALGDWRAPALHAAVSAVAAERSVALGKVAQPVRVAVTGGAVSPPIDVTLEILGRETTLERLDRAIARTNAS
jgi:uncharacterized protein YceH (UPF0502 family)